MNEKVDILLATYNGARFLKEQLDSILNQTHTEFRLIISDDKSTDKTRAIIEEYAAKDSRIEYYFQKKNLGVIKNFEFLLKKVESDYFMFSDQDDIWKENKIELSLAKLKEDDADLVYSDLEVVDRDLKTIYKSYWKLKGLENKVKKYNNFEALYDILHTDLYTTIPTKDLTEALFAAGINPLNYMETIPMYFLRGSNLPLKDFKIPSTITGIEARAFHMVNIEKIDIPEGVIQITNGVFQACSKLEYAYFVPKYPSLVL